MSRRGFTLIEAIAAITVGSVMLGIGVGILHLLMRAEETGRERVHKAQVFNRLAEQFRSDVGAAVRQIPTQGDRPKQWQFAMADDRTVTYRALPGEVRRDERTGSKLVRQESYALPQGYSAVVLVAQPPPAVTGDAAQPRAAVPHACAVATLVIAREPTPLAVGREMRIDVRLGKDHRFTKSPAGGQ
jgi:prepilin-type N-terminal cleavage/methylation domain-containing protein